jgi:nucleoprotein TPR
VPTLEAHAKQSRELDPLRERARAVQAELDARGEYVTRLEEENRRWQGRNNQLLTKVCFVSVGVCSRC